MIHEQLANGLRKLDHIKELLKLNVILSSGFHCLWRKTIENDFQIIQILGF